MNEALAKCVEFNNKYAGKTVSHRTDPQLANIIVKIAQAWPVDPNKDDWDFYVVVLLTQGNGASLGAVALDEFLANFILLEH